MSAAPTLAPVMPAGQAAEQLVVKLRPDLVIKPQFYEGMTHYVIKDPIALKYFRFKVEEYFLLQQFDGRQNLQDVKRAFERKYRPQTISIEDLTRFVSQLHEASIIQIDTAEQAKVLIDRRRKRFWKQIGQFFANILYIKVPVFDPERLLSAMYPWFRWIYTPYFVIASLAFMLSAITLVASQWATFQSRLPDFESFFDARSIIYFWCSLAVVKVIHEFGHGLTAKHFGGEVHEMGMLMLVLTPALYCDVTDSWLLPNKWHRIWISAAGIYVECFLAAVATFVWWNTDPGLFNSLALATMFICSVNTILFNANPLLRYDGYYVLADWLEIPNLRIKSSQFFAYLFQEKVLGLEVPVQSYMPRSRRFLFVFYAVASYVYRWVVTFSIVFFLYKFLKPHGLGSISMLLALGSIVPLLGMPVYQMIKFVRTPGRMRKMKKGRTAAFAVGLVTIVAAILLIPTPYRIPGSLVLMPAKPQRIYTEVPGRLLALDVRDGDWVKRGTVLARLSNPEKQMEMIEAQSEHDANMAKYHWYEREGTNSSRALALQFLNFADELNGKLNELHKQINGLTLASQVEGQVIGLPEKHSVGQWIKPDKPVCEIGDPHSLEAHLLVDQGDIDLIKKGNITRMKIYGTSEKTFRGRVSEVTERNRDEIPPELSNSAGGEIATKQDPKTGAPKPLTTVYEVTIPLDNPHLLMHPGQRGYAKIDGGVHTLGWWLWRLITKTFHFTL